MTTAKELYAYAQDPKVRKFLDVIAQAEGTTGYDTAFGGGTIPSLADHPRQLHSFTQTDGKANKTSAAGRYQFLQGTWDDVAGKLGLTDFGPESQDLAAIELMRRNGALDAVLAGDFDTAIQKSGSTWASLPSSPYAQPKRPDGFISNALDKAATMVFPAAQAGEVSADPFADIFQAPAEPGAMAAQSNAAQDAYADIFAAPPPIPTSNAPASKPEGSLVDSAVDAAAGFGVGLAQGAGNIMMGGQHWVGKGAKALGFDEFGDFSINSAQQGRDSIDQWAAPYAEAAPTASSIGELGGEIAATLPVGGPLGAGVKALAPLLGRSAPYAQALGNALRTGGMRAGAGGGATNMGIRMAGGGITGGVAAGLVDQDKATTGAVYGALFPLGASAIAGPGKALLEPLYQSGRNQILGRLLQESAGGQGDDVVRNLRQGQTLVPGTQPTAAELAQNPGIAALQKTATQVEPGAMNEMTARQASNNAARVAVLDDMAGTQGQREFYDQARRTAANELYDDAFRVSMDSLAPPQLEEINKLMGMPAIQDALKQARINAANAGVDIASPSGSLRGLHEAKLAMDDQISKLLGGTAAEANKARGITTARDRLVSFMEGVSPAYREARATFSEMSKPINQMDAIQDIAKRSINPLRETLYPNALARALRDHDLAGVLTSEQLSKLNAIKDDLARLDFANSSNRVGSDTVQKLAFSNMLNQAGIPSAIRNFGPAGVVGSLLERGGQAVYGGANKQMTAQLAEALMNPRSAADLMAPSTMATPKMQALAAALRALETTGYRAAPVMGAQ
ncbi:glycoside hydrolase family 104 protein [Pollutimonas sp. H1-120]|uniref:glycoside hydrolase family 24 protein n=1 Tax=Pollutimonas sp. H1-120 TaxID=3148824 RepID=UPI003B525066